VILHKVAISCCLGHCHNDLIDVIALDRFD